MKKVVYLLMALGIIVTSCGFVAAEKRPDAVKAPYPAKVDLAGCQGMIRGVSGEAEAPEKTGGEERTVPAAELIPAHPVETVKMTSDRL